MLVLQIAAGIVLGFVLLAIVLMLLFVVIRAIQDRSFAREAVDAVMTYVGLFILGAAVVLVVYSLLK